MTARGRGPSVPEAVARSAVTRPDDGSPLDEDRLRALALRPFQLFEALEVPCAYERSFKLEGGVLLAQRYMLAVEIDSIGPQRLLAVCRGLAMPESLFEQFQRAIATADLALFGFEGSGQGAIFKAYLEYRLAMHQSLGQTPDPEASYRLHMGFKWRADSPDEGLTTVYQCWPGLAADTLRERVDRVYRSMPSPVGRDAMRTMIDRGLSRMSAADMLFLDVGEAGQPGRGFDLNFYASGLRVADLCEPIRDAARALGVDVSGFDRLMHIAGPKRLGHLSAGLSRGGSEYLTVYFEP